MSAVRTLIGIALALADSPVAAREVVDASAPTDLAVTIYREPYGDFDRNNPGGFAMISETRTVTLPAGESTIRFEGVAEGMVAVSAIVTGLPGGTIEKNRNADLLSPAALVDGTLGNRVTISRTNPATGIEESEQAIVRTRADGGVVLQTSSGYEAVRCSGLPERMAFGAIPDGLSAQPVFSISTRDETGGTYEVTLTYLSWGFDWQAHYVTTLKEGSRRGRQNARMLSWLTLVNDNAQSFENAELLVVAGTLNIESDLEQLATPPRGEPLRLTCWPQGSTAAGTSPNIYPPPLAAPPPPMGAETIIVTAQKRSLEMFDAAAPVAVMAGEENLGDLKLFRVPEPVTVRAKGLKQVAFLNKGNVRGEFVHEGECNLYGRPDALRLLGPTRIIFQTENDEQHGLGVSMPRGGVTVFEPSAAGELLIGEDEIRDYPVGQEVEIDISESTKVFQQCSYTGASERAGEGRHDWRELRAVITNSGSQRARVRLEIADAADFEVRRTRGLKLRNGTHVIETNIDAGGERELMLWVKQI